MENSFRCVRQTIFCLLLLAISGHGTAGQTNSTSSSLVSSSDVTGAQDSGNIPSGTPFSDETGAIGNVRDPGAVPVEDAPTDETPMENTPTGFSPTGEIPTDDTPTEHPPTQEIPTTGVLSDDTPTDEAPTEDTLGQDNPTKGFPAEDTVADATPSEDTLGEEESSFDGIPTEARPIDDDVPKTNETASSTNLTTWSDLGFVPTAFNETTDEDMDQVNGTMDFVPTAFNETTDEDMDQVNGTMDFVPTAFNETTDEDMDEVNGTMDFVPTAFNETTDEDMDEVNGTMDFVPTAFNETTDADMDQVNGTMDFVPTAFNETTDEDMDQVNRTMDFVLTAFNETTDEDMDDLNGTMDFVPTAFNETTDEDMDQVNGTMVNATGVSTSGVMNVTTINETDATGFVDDNDEGLWDVGDDEWYKASDNEWYKASDNDTAAVSSSYDNFTDNGISPAANVTAAETNTTIESNTTSADVQNTTKLLDDYDDYDYYEYDGDYDDYDEYDGDYDDDDEEEEKESPAVTSANETDSSFTDDDSVAVTSDDSDAYVIPSNETYADNVTATYEPLSSNDTTESTAQAPEKADFVVYDSNGRPCLLASLNITLHFKYHVQVGLVRETYETISKNTQDGSSYRGSCEENTSTLSITWNNDTFTLNLTFLMQNETKDRSKEIDMNVLPPGANSSSQTWFLQQVSLSYNTANEKIFPGASPALERVSADDLRLFRTPQGMSYMCKTPEVVTLEFKEVDLSFNYVHLMPFGVQSPYFSNDTVQCSGDVSNVPRKEESYTIPLIVAAVLAGIVITILVVYATVRCVARRVRQAEYKQME